MPIVRTIVEKRHRQTSALLNRLLAGNLHAMAMASPNNKIVNLEEP